MMKNIDNMARIEREIERSACAEGIRLPERSEPEGPQGAGRMEAACEKNGWYVAVAMMPPERTTLHIEKFGEEPVTDDDAQAALNSAVAFAKAEFGTEVTVERHAEIPKLEDLLAYAVAHGEKAEEERIRAELVKMVEEL